MNYIFCNQGIQQIIGHQLKVKFKRVKCVIKCEDFTLKQ